MPVPHGSIDHFLPKSRRCDLAYEWSNYRLATHRVNLHKSDSLDVLDPFQIQPGWFVLDFPSCLVVPGPGLSPDLTSKIRYSIEVLKLNIDDSFVQERCDLMVEFSIGGVALPYLKRRYPFLAMEIERQNIQARVQDIFRTRN